MSNIRLATVLAAIWLSLAAAAVAQPAPPASAPGPGMMRGGGCCGQGWRAGPANTSGWSLMTRTERQVHDDKMRGMKSHDECRAYMDQHHAEMVARAKERGATMPAQPRGDACGWFKKS